MTYTVSGGALNSTQTKLSVLFGVNSSFHACIMSVCCSEQSVFLLYILLQYSFLGFVCEYCMLNYGSTRFQLHIILYNLVNLPVALTAYFLGNISACNCRNQLMYIEVTVR